MTQFDDVLPKIGDHGIYQISLLVFLSFVKFFAAFQTVSVVFTAADVDFWCSDLNVTTHNSSEWLNDCEVNNGTCQSWTFDSHGEFESTWRSQFGLVCDREKLVDISSSIYMLGLLFGSTLYGIVSDRFGRVPAACGAVLNTWVAGVALAFSPSVEFYISLRFLSGLGASGILSVCNAFVGESVTARYRMPWVLIGTNGWNVALCVISGIAYGIRCHWKLELVLAAPAVLVIPVIILFGESPRWLLAKNRPEDAFKRCELIARVNRTTPPPTFASDMKAVSETLISQQGQNPQVSIIDLLRSKNMRRPTLLMWNNFFCSSLLYYGLLLSTGKLGGDIFLNFLIGSAVAIPSSMFSIAVASLIGRPLLFGIAYSLSSVCMLAIAFLWGNSQLQTLVIALAITGRFFAAAALDSSWAYSAELFPTLVRNAGMGSSSTAARVGGFLAPLINMLGGVWQPLPFLIFACLNAVTSLLVLLLPETKGARLPESLDDADEEYVRPKLLRMLR